MKLHQLRALVLVHETGSIARAALQLRLSASSVSEAVQGLELHHGEVLLERTPAGSRLTPLGLKVVQHARQVFAALEAIDQEVALSQGKVEGWVRVSTFRSMAQQVLVRAMARLKQSHPGVQVKLLECTDCHQENLLQPLETGEADIAFLPGGEQAPDHAVKVLRDPFVALLPAGWPAEHPCQLEDLQKWPLVLTRNCDCTSRIGRYLQSHGVTPPSVIEVQDDWTMYNMVKAGLGCCLSARLAVPELPSGMQMVPLAHPLHRDIHMVVREGTRTIPAVRQFLQVLETLWQEGLPASH